MKFNQLYHIVYKTIRYPVPKTEEFYGYYSGISYLFVQCPGESSLNNCDSLFIIDPYYNLHKSKNADGFLKKFVPLFSISSITKVGTYNKNYNYCLEGTVDDRVKFSIDSVINRETVDFNLIKFGFIKRKTIIEKL